MNNQLTDKLVDSLLNAVRLERNNTDRVNNQTDHLYFSALVIALEDLKKHRKAAQGKFTKFEHALFGDMVAVDGEPLAVECVISTLNTMQSELWERRKAIKPKRGFTKPLIHPCTMDHQTHELKVDPIHYAAVVDGLKVAELRLNDRNFQAGDELVLREFDRGSQAYTGEQCTAYVQHVADVGELAPGFVLLSIEVLEEKKTS